MGVVQDDCPRVSTGIRGMDEVLGGGAPRGRLWLVHGAPGTGKTTFALQFLLSGVASGERLLYFSFCPSTEHVSDIARAHGWSLDGVSVQAAGRAEPPPQTIFPEVEIELPEQLSELRSAIDQIEPTRLVVDPVTSLRGDAVYLRREMRALKERLSARGCAGLLLDDRAELPADTFLERLAHGVMVMEQRTLPIGGVRRRLHIKKLRGAKFRDGYHDYRMTKEGLVVYPGLRAADYRQQGAQETVSSGHPVLDQLLGGGVDRGSSVLLLGLPGTGKSSVATQLAVGALARGERIAMYLFDENASIALARADLLGFPLRQHVSSGLATICSIDPGEKSPGEFAHEVREAVERDQARLVVIDSLAGYRFAMLDEPFMGQQLRALIAYLRERSVVVVLVAPVSSDSGTADRVDLGCIDDTSIVFQNYEHAGEVRTSISAFKRRTQVRSRTLCDVSLGPNGIAIGPLVSTSAATSQ